MYFSDGPLFVYHEDPVRTAQTRNAQGYLTLFDRSAFLTISGG